AKAPGWAGSGSGASPCRPTVASYERPSWAPGEIPAPSCESVIPDPPGAQTQPRGCSRRRGKLAITGVAQAGHDITLLIQVTVQRGQVDRHLRMGLAQGVDALRSGDERQVVIT